MPDPPSYEQAGDDYRLFLHEASAAVDDLAVDEIGRRGKDGYR